MREDPKQGNDRLPRTTRQIIETHFYSVCYLRGKYLINISASNSKARQLFKRTIKK